MIKKENFFNVFLVLTNILTYAATEYAAVCTTPENETGKCMPVKSCRSTYTTLLNLSNTGGNLTTNQIILLQKSQCDRQNDVPFVCCPPSEIQMNPDIKQNLTAQQCGQSAQSRIAGGIYANLFNYRWMALLDYDGNQTFRCAASLISEQYVISAAHCMDKRSELPISVRLGEYNISSEIDCSKMGRQTVCLPPHEDILIDKIFIPDQYVIGKFNHDIALIRLQRPVEYKRNINPICLPITYALQTQEPEEYTVAGWGRTETGKKSDALLYTWVPARKRNYCVDNLTLRPSDKLDERHICAGGENYRDSCKGDSGGPLFATTLYNNHSARGVQFGIVSVGVRTCGEVSAPAIYTNVSHYMQWITDHMSIQ